MYILASALPAYAADLQKEEYDWPRYKTENLQEGVDYDIGEGFTVYLDNSALNVSPNSSAPFHTQKWVDYYSDKPAGIHFESVYYYK